MFNELSSKQVKQLNRQVSSLLTLVEKVFFPLVYIKWTFIYFSGLDRPEILVQHSLQWLAGETIHPLL